MNMLSEFFDVTYGNKLDLNKMTPLARSTGGISFVGRSSQDNGVSATVAPFEKVAPYPAGLITVALGGSKLLASFVQEHPFYTAQNVAVLNPKREMTFGQKIYSCLCIRHNRFRYSAFGREANRTLKSLLIPDPHQCPEWASGAEQSRIDSMAVSLTPGDSTEIDTTDWEPFQYQDLFVIERGRGTRLKDLTDEGGTRFVTAIDSNNGLTGFTTIPPCHLGNTITVNRNGNGVGEAFYQPHPFCSTEDVHVFTPLFTMNAFIGIFLATLIRMERTRYGFGRKWGLERMNRSIIRLPVTKDRTPDWAFMERFMRSLPFSSQL